MGHHCCSKQKVKRGLWSPEEDERLSKHITTCGHGCWSSVPKLAGLQRCGKSCRLRWINYLRPDLKRGSFSSQEEQIIIDVHRILGNRWAQIAKHLPGRTDNEVKNFWNSCIKKKLIAQGLDPKTHNLISSNKKNACNLSHIQRQPTSVFSVTSQIRDASMEVNTPFIALPHPPPAANSTHPPPLHDALMNIPTFEFQNPNLVWTFKDQSSHASLDFTNRSSMESMQISSSSINPSGFGILDDNCMWGTSTIDPFEPARHEEMQPQQGQQEKVSEVEIDKTNEEKGGQEVENSFDSSNFDLEFMQSTLSPCGMYCNMSSMDQLEWDC